MGGNAIKTVPIRRITADEYALLSNDVLGKLAPLFKQAKIIPAYGDKPDFGDMDCLVDIDNNPGDIRKLIQSTFEPHELHHNGEVYSFDYKAFQIDVITTHTRTMPIHLTYYAYNDLGNLIGKLSSALGLKLGHKGLYSAVRRNNGTTHLADVELSVDPEKILTFLGYDYARYQKGFQTLDDIFKYAVSTPYFNKAIFAESNRNHQDRVRSNKRPVFQAFMAFLEEAKGLPEYQHKENPMEYIQMISDAFPEADLINKRKQLFAEFERRKALQQKFKEAISPAGLKDKALGDAIVLFKSKYDDYLTFVEKSTPAEILESFNNPLPEPDLNP